MGGRGTWRAGVGGSTLCLCLALLPGCGGSEADLASGGPGEVEAVAASPGPTSAPADTLVVVANLAEARLHLMPRDWADLFHFRFSGRVLVLDPATSPPTAAFMEGVLRSEARRTGVPDAGFDWLRRLDRAVASYEDDSDEAAFRLRRGEAAFAILPASEVGSLLDREGFAVVGMSSGAVPEEWGRGLGPAGSDGADPGTPGRGRGPEPPSDWLAIWAAEVRGKG